MSTEPSSNSFTYLRSSMSYLIEMISATRYCQKIQPIECQEDIPEGLQEKCKESYRKCLEIVHIIDQHLD